VKATIVVIKETRYFMNLIMAQSSVKDASVFNKMALLRRAADTRKKSAENTVRVRLGYLLIFIFL